MLQTLLLTTNRNKEKGGPLNAGYRLHDAGCRFRLQDANNRTSVHREIAKVFQAVQVVVRTPQMKKSLQYYMPHYEMLYRIHNQPNMVERLRSRVQKLSWDQRGGINLLAIKQYMYVNCKV